MVIKRIKEPVTELWFGNKFIGKIYSYIELLYVQCEVKKENVEGYYILFGTTKIPINSNGLIDKWPTGFYDEVDSCYKELFGL
jgi:hypothetical protein